VIAAIAKSGPIPLAMKLARQAGHMHTRERDAVQEAQYKRRPEPVCAAGKYEAGAGGE
jgi:hypothetical protein